MLPTSRMPTHPGEMLAEEFLAPLGVTQVDFANHLKIPIQRVNEIVNGKRGVTPETALLFASALRTTPEFWINLQSSYDLARARSEMDTFPTVIAAGKNYAAAGKSYAAAGIHRKAK